MDDLGGKNPYFWKLTNHKWFVKEFSGSHHGIIGMDNDLHERADSRISDT